MGMTRADAITYLAGKLGVLLADAGIAPNAAGLGSVVDDALLLTGVAYADLATATVADADVIGFRAVLIYQALQAALDAVVNRVSYSKSLGTPSVSKSESRNQIVDNLTKRLALAKAAADPYVVEVGDGGFSTGAVALGAIGGDKWSF
jgi:hypothetical protein